MSRGRTRDRSLSGRGSQRRARLSRGHFCFHVSIGDCGAQTSRWNCNGSDVGIDAHGCNGPRHATGSRESERRRRRRQRRADWSGRASRPRGPRGSEAPRSSAGLRPFRYHEPVIGERSVNARGVEDVDYVVEEAEYTETKDFFRTSEFWIALIGVFGVLLRRTAMVETASAGRMDGGTPRLLVSLTSSHEDSPRPELGSRKTTADLRRSRGMPVSTLEAGMFISSPRR